MAIVQGLCNSFKQECLQAVHDFDNDTFKIALFDSSADLNLTTTVYSATNEVSGTGYIAGGENLTASTALSGAIAYIDFSDVSWTSATINDMRCALIYNSSKANRAVCVLDFLNSYNVLNGTFSIVWPAAGPTTAIVRFN